MAADAYYVCADCAHYWASPEWPDKCENCGASSLLLDVFSEAEDAEDHSERIMELKRHDR